MGSLAGVWEWGTPAATGEQLVSDSRAGPAAPAARLPLVSSQQCEDHEVHTEIKCVTKLKLWTSSLYVVHEAVGADAGSLRVDP